MPWTPEEAAAYAREGGKARQQQRRAEKAMSSDAKARRVFEAEAEYMARELVKAAKGEGAYAELDPKERAQFALKVLEYGVGRPTQAPKRDESAAEPQSGLAVE